MYPTLRTENHSICQENIALGPAIGHQRHNVLSISIYYIQRIVNIRTRERLCMCNLTLENCLLLERIINGIHIYIYSVYQRFHFGHPEINGKIMRAAQLQLECMVRRRSLRCRSVCHRHAIAAHCLPSIPLAQLAPAAYQLFSTPTYGQC